MNTLDKLVKKLSDSYLPKPAVASDTFYWSPADKTVYYDPDNHSEEGQWALLHESGHALLEHVRYFSDIELVMMELDAWEKAKEIAKELKITISEDHIQDCLDSYRNWLHKRSLCPDCSLSGIQVTSDTNTCVFCHKRWHVSSDRFCRPYRKQI